MESDEFKDLERIHAPVRHQPPGQSAAQIARTLAFQAKIDRPPGSDKEYTPAQTAMLALMLDFRPGMVYILYIVPATVFVGNG